MLNNGYVKIGVPNGSTAWYTGEFGDPNTPMRITPGSSYNGSPRIELSANSTNVSGTPGNVSASNNPMFEGGLINFTNAFATMQGYSSSLSALTDNATITNANGDPLGRTGLPSQVKITLNPGTNVLNLSGTEMNNVSDFVYNNQPDATRVLVVNVNAPGTFTWNVWNSGQFGGLANCAFMDTYNVSIFDMFDFSSRNIEIGDIIKFYQLKKEFRIQKSI